MSQHYKLNTSFYHGLYPQAILASINYSIAKQDESFEGRLNKSMQDLYCLLSESESDQNLESYRDLYHQLSTLYDEILETESSAQKYDELFEKAKISQGDEKKAVLIEMMKYRGCKDKLGHNISEIKHNIYMALSQIHEIFAIPPKEMSESLLKIAFEYGGYNEKVSFLNNLFTKKRSHGSNDFSDLLKAKEIAEAHPEEIDSKEMCILYMNLSYAYQVFDYYKSLEYMDMAEKYPGHFDDEIIEEKAQYYISTFNKAGFLEYYRKVDNPQKAFDMISSFKKIFPHDIPPRFKLQSLKGTKPTGSEKAQRNVKLAVGASNKKSALDQLKDSFYDSMKTGLSTSAQNTLSCVLFAMKNNLDALEFLREVNEAYPNLREESIFNPNLLIAEMKIYTENKMFDEAIKKLHEIDQKLIPYGTNTKSINFILQSEKHKLLFHLAESREIDNIKKAESLLGFFPEDEVELYSILLSTFRRYLESKAKAAQVKELDDTEHVREKDHNKKLKETEAVTSIALPSNVKEFSEQVNLGSIPLEALSGKLSHAFFMCMRSMSFIDNMLCVNQNTEIRWEVKEDTYLYPTHEGQKVVKMHSVPNHYITIDPKLASELDPSELDACLRVLEMGRSARKQGQAGVKMLGGKLYELKILGDFGDLRLISKSAYEIHGKRLIVFDRRMDHDDVKSILSKSKIHVESLDKEEAASASAAPFSEDDVFIPCQEYYAKVLQEDGDVLPIGVSVDF